MTYSPPNAFHGIYPSTLCPLTADLKVDEAGLGAHVRSLAQVDGIAGVLANGHAGENFLLSRSEKRQVLEVTRAALGDGQLMVAGVNAESSLDAADEARDAEAAGADAVMVFAPNAWALSQPAPTAVRHHTYIRDATALPLMLFQGSVKAGQMAYPDAVLRELVRLPGVVGIKEGSWETSAYEATRRLVAEEAPDVAVMASGDEHLFTSYVLGSEGSLVSLAVLIPETIVALNRAVKRGDLTSARELHATVYPLAKAIYGDPPPGRATPRLKGCLRLLGDFDNDLTRPPVARLTADEETMLRTVLSRIGLLSQ